MPMQPMAFEGGYNPYQGKNRLRQFGFPGNQPFQPRPFEGGPGALGGPFKGGMPNQPMGGMPFQPFEGGMGGYGKGQMPFMPPMNHLMRFQPLMNYGRSVQQY